MRRSPISAPACAPSAFRLYPARVGRPSSMRSASGSRRRCSPLRLARIHSRARHDPRARAEPLHLHVGEAADQPLGARNDLGHVLAEPGALHPGNGYPGTGDAPADVDGRCPNRRAGRRRSPSTSRGRWRRPSAARGASPLRPSSALRSWRPGAPGPRRRGDPSPSRAVRRASRRRPPDPSVTSTRSAGAAGAAAGARQGRRAPRLRSRGGCRRSAAGASAAGASAAVRRRSAAAGAAAGAAGAAAAGAAAGAAAAGAAAAGAPTATGTAGGATTTGAACEMSTSRRGSDWPGRTRSARTTFSPSSSFANRGAYRMYITIRNSTVATPRRVSSWAMLNTHPPGVLDGGDRRIDRRLRDRCGDGGGDDHDDTGEHDEEPAGCLHRADCRNHSPPRQPAGLSNPQTSARWSTGSRPVK